MRLVGQSSAPEIVLREMLHLLSELLGLNRGRIVLADSDPDKPGQRALQGISLGAVRRANAPRPSSIRFACGLTRAEVATSSEPGSS